MPEATLHEVAVAVVADWDRRRSSIASTGAGISKASGSPPSAARKACGTPTLGRRVHASTYSCATRPRSGVSMTTCER